MSSHFGPMAVIADPSADRGAMDHRIPEVESCLTSRAFDFRTVRASGPGDIQHAVREAIARGDRFLVVVGDDRSLHHAVNGMIDGDRPVAPDLVVGMVAADSRSDFVQTFGLPGDVVRACGHLEGDTVFPIDVGKVSCVDQAGRPLTSYFPNVAQAGLGGAVMRRLERLTPRLGRARQFLAFWASMTTFRPGVAELTVGDRRLEETAHNVVVANGQYHGGGMRLSPRSWPGDGLLDVLVMTGPKSDAFTLLPRIYRGEHLPHSNILETKARTLALHTQRPWPVEADGIFLGFTPATFGVIRQPIRLKI